ncbi:hypothetical protein L1887_55106 [Cichorium endivia]|nr:hypothetical protein L1887_55106 [Cichorium endivia]
MNRRCSHGCLRAITAAAAATLRRHEWSKSSASPSPLTGFTATTLLPSRLWHCGQVRDSPTLTRRLCRRHSVSSTCHLSVGADLAQPHAPRAAAASARADSHPRSLRSATPAPSQAALPAPRPDRSAPHDVQSVPAPRPAGSSCRPSRPGRCAAASETPLRVRALLLLLVYQQALLVIRSAPLRQLALRFARRRCHGSAGTANISTVCLGTCWVLELAHVDAQRTLVLPHPA